MTGGVPISRVGSDSMGSDSGVKLVDDDLEIEEPPILKARELSLSYYYDQAGPMMSNSLEAAVLPEMGLKLNVGCDGETMGDHGKRLVPCRCYQPEINYGAWADRQRDLIKNFFLPFMYEV